MRTLKLVARTGACLCGLKVAYHFDSQNRKLSCEETRTKHPRAQRRFTSFITGLRATHGNLIGMIGVS